MTLGPLIVNGVEVHMSEAEAAEFEASRVVEIVTPQSVTMRQARLALMGAGLLASVDAAIDALPEPQRTAARIEWDYSQTVERNRGLVSQLAAAMGLTSEQVDQLFITAEAL